jgi:chromosome partitioning protein
MILAIVNNKGGVGKTTTAVHVAYALATQGTRVLAVDMDTQANLLMHFFPSKQVNEERKAQERATPRPVLHHASGVDVLHLSFLETDQATYTAHIREAAQGYEIVLIDCPPSLETRTNAALDAADSVLIPTEAEHFSVKGIQNLLSVMETRDLNISGILVTKFDKKAVAHEHLAGHLHDVYGNYMMPESVIHSNIFRSSSAIGQTAYEWSGKRKSAALDAYSSVATKLTEEAHHG